MNNGVDPNFTRIITGIDEYRYTDFTVTPNGDGTSTLGAWTYGITAPLDADLESIDYSSALVARQIYFNQITIPVIGNVSNLPSYASSDGSIICINGQLSVYYNYRWNLVFTGEREAFRINLLGVVVSHNVFTSILVCQYFYNALTPLKRVRMIATTSGDTTAYDIQIYNTTTTDIVLQTTAVASSVSRYISFDLGEVTIAPTADCVLEVSAKRNDGSGVIVFYEFIWYNDF